MTPVGVPPTNRILLVHHHGETLAQLTGAIANLGYRVAAAVTSGAEALAYLHGHPADIVLVPIGIPGWLSLAADIRTRFGLPVVLLVAAGEDDLLVQAGIRGPFGYIQEPYRDRELQMNLEMALLTETVRTQQHELEGRFFAVNLDLLCCLDFNGFFKRLNPAWERTLRFTRDELMSRSFIEFVHPEDRERTLEQNHRVRAGGQARGFENRYLCKDGSHRWFLWNAAPDFGQRVIYSVARDITERKRGEEEREKLVSDLRAALAEVKSLQAILPICSYCKKIRDDANYWRSVEAYISAHTNTVFTHGICPHCFEREVEPQLRDPG